MQITIPDHKSKQPTAGFSPRVVGTAECFTAAQSDGVGNVKVANTIDMG